MQFEKLSDELSTYKLINISGIQLSYSDSGGAKPVLFFIHGLAAYAGSWQPLVEKVQQDYRCICIDLPGHGHSAVSSKGYDFSWLGELIRKFIQHLNVVPFACVGHSLGGQLIAYLCDKKMVAAEKIVLLAPAGFEQFTWLEQQLISSGMEWMPMIQSPADYIDNMLLNSFYGDKLQGAILKKELLSLQKKHSSHTYHTIIKSYVRAMLATPVHTQLMQLHQDVLILFGQQDALIPNPVLRAQNISELAISVAEKMKRAEVHIIPQAGHLIHWEKTKVVSELMLAFLQKNKVD